MNKKMICSVCGQNQAEGVFASRIAPVSSAYCKSCLTEGDEPYFVLVTHVAHLSSLHPERKLSQKLLNVKRATLTITGKTKEQFENDVKERLDLFE